MTGPDSERPTGLLRIVRIQYKTRTKTLLAQKSALGSYTMPVFICSMWNILLKYNFTGIMHIKGKWHKLTPLLRLGN